jgi:hypothetical protein
MELLKLSTSLNEFKPLARGTAVQLDPIKPTLKAPGTKRLKLKCDEPLGRFVAAVQADPVGPTLIAPGTKRLKLKPEM